MLWPDVFIGRAGGETMHRVLEAVPVGADPDAVAALVRSIAAEEGASDREEKILEMVSNVMAGRAWERAVRSGRMLREVPFCVKTGTGYASGKMDLVFQEDGGAVVVDYKADNVAERSVEERLKYYEPQGAAYAEAMERLLGVPVKEVIFHFAAPDVERSLTFTGS